MYLQFPDAKTIILIRQTVCANISDISDSQMKCYPIEMSACTDISGLILFVLAFGNTTLWEKLKVWRLEINENIVRIGQCKADVCLLTLYKAKIGVSRSSSLAGWEVAFFPLELALF